jgi:hypothetical protein
MAGGGQQRPVNDPQLRAHDLAAQDLELVAQHQQLDVLDVQAAAATQERAQQRPHRKVRNETTMPPILPTPAPTPADMNIGALHEPPRLDN